MDMKSEQEMWPDILMLRGLITIQNVDWPGLVIVLWLKKFADGLMFDQGTMNGH